MPDRGESGLTLIEMLAVLAIIGIVGSIAVLGMGGGDRSASVEAEARRLARSVQLAAEDALVSGRPMALAWDEAGYSYLEWNLADREWNLADREWRPGNAGLLAARHVLPPEMRIAAGGERPFRRIDADNTAPFALTLSQGSTSWTIRFDGVNALALPDGDG